MEMDQVIALLNGLNDRFDQMDDRFDQVDSQLKSLSSDLSVVNGAVIGNQESLVSVGQQLSIQSRSIYSIETQLGSMDLRNAATNARFPSIEFEMSGVVNSQGRQFQRLAQIEQRLQILENKSSR